MPRNLSIVTSTMVSALRGRCTAAGRTDPGTIRVAQAISFWDRVCPGYGLAMVDLLVPFYACGASFPYSHWDKSRTNVKGEPWESLGIGGSLAVDHLAVAANRLGPQCRLRDLVRSHSAPLLRELNGYVREHLAGFIWSEVGHNLWLGMKQHLDDDQMGPAFDLVWGGLSDSIEAACATRLLSQPSTYQPLLDLWLAGFWPVGTTMDGTLLVLCAEPADTADRAASLGAQARGAVRSS